MRKNQWNVILYIYLIYPTNFRERKFSNDVSKLEFRRCVYVIYIYIYRVIHGITARRAKLKRNYGWLVSKCTTTCPTAK